MQVLLLIMLRNYTQGSKKYEKFFNEILIKSHNNMYNLFISNKELKTPNKNKFNFDNKKTLFL